MIALLLACTGAPMDSAQPHDTGAPLPGSVKPSAEAEWSPEQLEQALQALLAQGFPTAREAMGLYLEMLSHGDDKCPGNAEYIDERNLRGCTAESGYYYSGVSTYERQFMADELGNSIRFEGSTGDYLFRDPEGHEMEGGGHQTLAIIGSPEAEVDNVLSETSGTFVWQGDDGVFQQPVSSSLQVVAVKRGGVRQLNMLGAVQYMGQSLYFNTDLYEDCAWRTRAGTVEIRDPSGGWHTLSPQSCESDCMTAHYGGEARGEVCVSLAPIATAFGPELDQLQ